MNWKRKQRKQRRREEKFKALRQKRDKRADRVVITNDGPPCPRCDCPMEVREHAHVEEKHLKKPYYYSRWYCCMNNNCKTTLVMPEKFKIARGSGRERRVIWGDTWDEFA